MSAPSARDGLRARRAWGGCGRRGPSAAAVLVSAALAGCMVGPNYHRPDVPAPTAWGELAPVTAVAGDPVREVRTSVATTDPVAASWWTSFGDAELASLVERAVAGNYDVQQAEARIREARAARRIAAADLWPAVQAGASYDRERTSANGPTGSSPLGGKWIDLFQVGFDANWELDVFGGTRRAVEAADAAVAAAEADRDAVLVTLLGDVGFEYVTYRSLQRRVALATENLEAQRATLGLTRRLLDAGLAPELDVTRAEAVTATTAATIPALRRGAAQAMHRLGTLVGAPPMTLEQELAVATPIPAPPSAVPIGMPSDVLLRRPDVARAERDLASATAEIGVATRDLFPRFFITGAADLQSLHATDLFTWQSRLASLGPSVTWPVFEGGRIRANIAFRTAAQAERLAAYRGAVLQAFQEVEDALVAFAHQQATSAELARAVGANDRTAELARRLYGQGLTDFLTVLDAERSLFASQDALAESQRDLALDLVALYKAVGGGWQVGAPAAAAPASVASRRAH